MTRAEFTIVMTRLEAGCSKPCPAESMAVYFDLLGDLDFGVFNIAANRVILEHRWATFPSIAELREAAAETIRGQVKELSPAEGWDMAWRAVARIDLEIPGSLQRACEGLPPIVVEAMKAFGVPAMVHGKEPVGVVRGQFLKIFEQLAAREKRIALLPAALRAQIEAIGQEREAKPLPAPVNGAIARIGVEKS